MDYIIERMSGKPGLIKTVENLLKSGILDSIENSSDYDTCENLSGKELAYKVITDLKRLTVNLPDQNLAKALNESADDVLAKL